MTKKPEPEPEDSVDFEPSFLAELDADGVEALLKEERETLEKVKKARETDNGVLKKKNIR